MRTSVAFGGGVAVALAAIVGVALAGEGRFFRPQSSGAQYECMAVPLAYSFYKLDEAARMGQDASNLSLYPTRLPRGWTPMGTTEISSLAQLSMGGGRTAEEKRPAVMVCRELGGNEGPAATPAPRVLTPTEGPTVDPAFFDDEP